MIKMRAARNIKPQKINVCAFELEVLLTKTEKEMNKHEGGETRWKIAYYVGGFEFPA